MRRTLCSVLSLTILTSLLSGCTTVPARPAMTGPQVYGYTLNQQLTAEQLQKLTDSGKSIVGSFKLYQQHHEDGSVLGLYADSKLWLDTVTSTSREFSTESDCQAALEADGAQVKAVIDEFNAQRGNPQGTPRQVGDVYAAQAADACQRIGDPGAGADAFRYTLWVTLRTETSALDQFFPRKVEETHISVWSLAAFAVLITATIAVIVMSKGAGLGSCTSYQSPNYPPSNDPYSKKECTKELKGQDN
ncbi:hypothetical protein HX867_25065 [Pseudomonas gingeri]|uniref:hypothetical protein n=1 Tax=Pseudomonas gingeri TaxID=117681 RepID=UPI0015A3EBD8|nr:hypothetical protein [Pseudomonas gingeri]NVZ65378.1 hypothetical protein [Pseudomonas gingeri]NVZ77631.1 hypothetical protein [Pseudomonas gingeri]